MTASASTSRKTFSRDRRGRVWWLAALAVGCTGVVVFIVIRSLGPTAAESAPREDVLPSGENLVNAERDKAAPAAAAAEPTAASDKPPSVPPEPAAPPPRPSGSRATPSTPTPKTSDVTQLTEEQLRKEAIDAVTRLMKDFPNDPDPIGLMGNVHVGLGQTAEAVACWEKCIEMAPNRVDGYLGIAEVRLKEGQFEKAEELARQAMQVDSRAARANKILGEALLGLGKPNEALVAFQQELKISPNSARSRFLLGQTYRQLGQHLEAKERYEAVLQLDPDYTEAYYVLAIVCARLRLQDEAAEYRKRFQELKDRDWANLQGIRSVFDREESLFSSSRNVARTLTNVGLAYRQHGYAWTAEKHWRRAAILDPEDTVCREELAALYQQNRRTEEALQVCEQLREIAPKNARYHYGAGVLYARMNRVDVALSALEQALELDPDNESYRDTCARIRRTREEK